jgi:hypothetical protein
MVQYGQKAAEGDDELREYALQVPPAWQRGLTLLKQHLIAWYSLVHDTLSWPAIVARRQASRMMVCVTAARGVCVLTAEQVSVASLLLLTVPATSLLDLLLLLLQALESFVSRSPADARPFLDQLLAEALRYIKYDPNYGESTHGC